MGSLEQELTLGWFGKISSLGGEDGECLWLVPLCVLLPG